MDPGFSSIPAEGWTLDSPLYASFSLMGVPEELLLLPKGGPWICLYVHPFSDGCTWGAAALAEGWTRDSPLYLSKDGPWILLYMHPFL